MLQLLLVTKSKTWRLYKKIKSIAYSVITIIIKNGFDVTAQTQSMTVFFESADKSENTLISF